LFHIGKVCNHNLSSPHFSDEVSMNRKVHSCFLVRTHRLAFLDVISTQVNQEEADVSARLNSLERSLKSLEESLSSSAADMHEKLNMLLSRGNAKCACAAPCDATAHETADRRLDSLDRKLNMIAEAVGVRVRAKEEEDAEDRKRLKERLKEALALEKQGKLRSANQDEKESWAEYIFGIAQPNGRIGKMGSRCMRPNPQ
jgi:hypothetical protein